jgi:hypothetical protein
MIVLIIYIIFAIINIIICSIITYIDYNNGNAITLKIIGIALLLIFLSIFGTIYFIVCFFDDYGDVIILQKKKLK